MTQRSFGSSFNAYANGDAPDPDTYPELYDGVLPRRTAAYLIDLVILAVLTAVIWMVVALFGVLTLGLGFLLMPLLGLVPLAYWAFTIGGPNSATWGMQIMDVRVFDVSGGHPGPLIGALHAVLFNLSMAFTFGLVLIIPMLNSRARCLHDYVCGTVVVNEVD